MLTELSIKNFAIIEEVSLTFTEGLTVLTGETGAGKSIIIDAVQLLTGGRGSVDYVRHGAKKAEIEGLFIITNKKHIIFDLAEQYGIETEDQMLVLSRTITSGGKSICRVNGKLVTLAILREFGKNLVDIHSQHDSQLLMDKSNHLFLLDLYDEQSIHSTKEEYLTLYEKFLKLKQTYEKLSTNEQEMSHRLDLLQFQKQELEQANLQPNEDIELERERNQLHHFENIYMGIHTAYNALYGENKALEWLSIAKDALEDIQKYDSTHERRAEELTNHYYALESLSFELSELGDQLFYDEERLNEIEARLDEINRLKRKYGSSVNEMIEYLAKIEEEIEQIENKDSHLAQLERELKEIAKDAYLEAEQLHHLRKQMAKALEKAIHKEFKSLHLEQATFAVRFATKVEPGEIDYLDIEQINLHPNGIDDIQFMVATNPGEPLKEVHKVASGGELSRIMLAIKKIFAQHQGVTSIIFDEVDTGVSGRVAQAMAEKIYEVAQAAQVLCITHLPQVAAMADHHKSIQKIDQADRVITTVQDLTKSESIEELSKMMTGNELTATALEHGKNLLDLAESFKKKITSNQ